MRPGTASHPVRRTGGAWLVLTLPALALAALSSRPALTSAAAKPTAPARVTAALDRLPLYFVENKGQVHGMRGYYVPGSREALYFSPEGVTYALASGVQAFGDSGIQGDSRLDSSARLSPPGPPNSRLSWAQGAPPSRLGAAVRQEFVGARGGVRPVGTRVAGARFSYFRGKASEWKTARSFSEVQYRQVWPGIDAVFHGQVSKLKYEYRVAPGADPSDIRLRVRGASAVRVDPQGRLVAETAAGSLTDEKPYAYQVIDGQRVEVPCAYRLLPASAEGTTEYAFAVGEYDRSRELVLDPATLVYCGYIGGSSRDATQGVAVDAAGNAYVAGYTFSDQNSFPVKTGPSLAWGGGGFYGDAFVAKVKPDGSGLVYCGYIGGSQDDFAAGIAVDGAGSAYVTGWTNSDETTFPVKGGPSLTFGTVPTTHGFVAKVSPDGSSLQYCGYIAGNSLDSSQAIAVDAAGSAYVAGYTASTSGFARVGPSLTNAGGFRDAFVAKVKADGSGFEYCGYIGGSGRDEAWGVAVDAAGSAYVAGFTTSDENSFPVKAGPSLHYSGGSPNGDDGFVAKVAPDGSGLEYCGYIGGTGDDAAQAVAVDAAGSAYVAGFTTSGQTSFPVKTGPSLAYGGAGAFAQGDAFVAKVAPDGTSLDYCGYIGGSNDDVALGIGVDSAGSAYVAGYTASDQSTFPVKDRPSLTYDGGTFDAFVAKVTPTGAGLDYCGYIGGSDSDGANGIAIDAVGNAYVVGVTHSDAGSFPVSVGPSLTPGGGDSDGFIAKVLSVTAAPSGLTVTPLSTSRLQVQWVDNSEDEQSFQVQASTDGGATWPLSATVPAAAGMGSTVTFTVAGLTPASRYTFRVRAFNGSYYSAFAGPVSAFTQSVPAAPSNLMATVASGTSLKLTWTDNSTDEQGFRLWRSTDGGSTWTLTNYSGGPQPGTGNSVSYTDMGLINGTTYTYRAEAYNDSTHAYSNLASAVPLAAPSNLSVTPLSTTRLQLQWVDHTVGEQGFQVQGSTDGGATWPLSVSLQAASGTGSTVTYTAAGLAAGTSYTFRVRAFSGSSFSGYAGPVSASTQSVPAAPSNLTATAASKTSIKLTWTDNATNEQGFRVWRSTNGGSTWTLTNYVGGPQPGTGNSVSYTDTGLTTGTTYTYRVEAYNDSTHAYSSNASATP